MPTRASAKRYSRALSEIALQRDRLDQWAGDLRLMSERLQNEELRAFLEHAKVPLHQKLRATGEVLEGIDPLVHNLLSVLISRGIVGLIHDVEAGYQRLLNQHRGREQVEVRSAVPLEDAERDRVVRFLTGLISKEVVLETSVDPSILGGLVIKVGDKLIDGSARTKLEELGKQLQAAGA